MIELSYPRVYKTVGGVTVIQKEPPPGVNMYVADGRFWLDPDCTVEATSDYWRSVSFGLWDIPYDEDQKKDILEQLAKEQKDLEKRLETVKNLWREMAAKETYK